MKNNPVNLTNFSIPGAVLIWHHKQKQESVKSPFKNKSLWTAICPPQLTVSDGKKRVELTRVFDNLSYELIEKVRNNKAIHLYQVSDIFRNT